MIGLLQRVSSASVIIDGTIIGQIDQGMLVLLGVEKNDTEDKAKRLIERLLSYRIFPDKLGKMNLSLNDIQAGMLIVPQFTLAANTKKGTRPGFSCAAAPELAESLFNYCIKIANENHQHIAQGKFGANMKVNLTNDGPVTFWLNT